jgi:hypothetical protein
LYPLFLPASARLAIIVWSKSSRSGTLLANGKATL